MLDRITEYARCLRDPERWAIATIIATRGSSPSPVGTSMAVSCDLEIIGSLSGGCVESSVAVVAQECLEDGTVRRESFGPEGAILGGVGLTCGGEIEVLVQPLGTVEDLAELHRLAHEDPEEPAELTLRVRDDSGAELLIDERREGAPRLFLSGVHDFSTHLARLALQSGWRVQIADVRPAFATASRVPEGVRLAVGDPATALRAFLGEEASSPWTAVCVMTHHQDLDVPVLDAALRAADHRTVDFIGAMGSRRTHARRDAALEELGHSAGARSRVRSPLGIDIQAATPSETAISIFSQLIATKNTLAEDERIGRPLSAGEGPIHRIGSRHRSIVRELPAERQAPASSPRSGAR